VESPVQRERIQPASGGPKWRLSAVGSRAPRRRSPRRRVPSQAARARRGRSRGSELGEEIDAEHLDAGRELGALLAVLAVLAALAALAAELDAEQHDRHRGTSTPGTSTPSTSMPAASSAAPRHRAPRRRAPRRRTRSRDATRSLVLSDFATRIRGRPKVGVDRGQGAEISGKISPTRCPRGAAKSRRGARHEAASSGEDLRRDLPSSPARSTPALAMQRAP